MTNSNVEKVLELKGLGNDCMKADKYSEAVLHYTHAIKIDKSSPQLFSNRSYAFLKLQHFYYAIKDAKEAITRDPSWFKGYFRQAEVEFATKYFADALISYQRAYQIQPDPTLLECIVRTTKELQRQQKFEQQIPWVASGMGLLLGVILIVLDATLPKTSIFQHPIIQMLVSITISCAGLGLGYCYKWFTVSQRKSLLEPPIDLLGNGDGNDDDNNDEEKERREPEKRHHPKYSKAQARQRYRKGKS